MNIPIIDNLTVAPFDDEDTDCFDATEGSGAVAWAFGSIFLLFFCIGAWWL